MTEITPEVKSLELDDATLEYLYYPGGERTLIFLHATGFLPWLWHPLARELAPEFSVIAPYFCDHRAADPEAGGLSWLTLAEDLCALCESRGLANPCIVGHSMGGTVATLAASLFGKTPEKLVLIEPIFLPPEIYVVDMTVEQHPLASRSIKRKDHWGSAGEAREYLRSKKLFRDWDDEMFDLYIRYGMVSGDGGGLTLACSPRQEAAQFMGSRAKDPWPLLEKVDCPVLILEGETSENKNYIDLAKAASLFPHAEHRIIPKAAHLVPMEKPKETLEAIRGFLS